jgi:acyl-coenzyme A thioesterase PaaI-like protein
MKALTNDQWGVDSNCFVCEPRNQAGLRIPFFHDEANDAVVATFALDDRFSGAPTYLHGGVLLAVLDEAMAWATIALGRRWAVTGETTTRFEHPVRVGQTYTVTATLDPVPAVDPTTLSSRAEFTDHEGRTCARSWATFVVLGEAQAAEAAGVAPDRLSNEFLRPA